MQLADNVPSLRRHICNAVAERSDIASLSLSDQWHQLVLSPLSRLDSNLSPSSYVLIVDALDECDKEEHIRIILQLLAEARTLKAVRLRVFLTSRPEIPIRQGMYRIPKSERQDFVLQNIPSEIINHDISLFLEHNLREIGQEWTLTAGWPGEQAFRQLVLNASGLFIWAATVCRFIREGKRFALKRLNTILEGSSSTVIAPEKHLNEIYITVLKHSVSSEYTDEEKEELFATLRHTLGSVVVLLSPLSSLSLSRLLHLPEFDRTIAELHAILDIPEDETYPLRLHHPSFRDFLLNKDRCGDSGFWVNEEQAHQMMAGSCILLMSSFLKQDICGVGAPGTLVTDIEISQVKKCLPSEVQYACLYWVQHLQKSGARLYDKDQVHLFLQAHLLHWLEALSWIRKTSEGILAIFSLEALILVSLFI